MSAPAQRAPARLRLAGGERRNKRAFTLIELLAVLFIIALVLGITLPNLSLRSDRVLLGCAEDLAARLSFARQRAVATGSPHRVVIDLDAAAWWIEVRPEAADASSAVAAAAPGAATAVQLVAPPPVEQPFVALAGPFGRPRQLPDGVFFSSIETLAAGPVDSGQVGLAFEEDGTADPALLVLENEDGSVVSVEYARLADEVQIRRE